MSNDIQPLTSIMPTPLVREKRHYPNDQKQQENKQQKKTTIDELEHDADVEIYEAESALETNMDTDGKNTGVEHIDEYV